MICLKNIHISLIFITAQDILLQERVWEDVAVAMSFRQADRSWARRFAVASPRFIRRRLASTVLSQDCLGRPILHLQLSGGPAMQAWRQWELGDDPVRGRLGRDVQWRTDDGCGQNIPVQNLVENHYWDRQLISSNIIKSSVSVWFVICSQTAIANPVHIQCTGPPGKTCFTLHYYWQWKVLVLWLSGL